MADKENDTSTPSVAPKPVHIGGESLADRIAPHIKKILIGCVLIAVAVTIVVAIRWRKQVVQENATAKLNVVIDVARRAVGPEDVMPGQPASKDPRFNTSKERALAVLDSMVKQGADGGPTYKAAMLLDAGRVDDAIAEYRKGEKLADIEGVLAREGLGIALETKALAENDATARQKLLEDALAAFTAMQPDEKGPRRAYALYHQGRIELTLGKRAEAKAAFEKAKELGASTELPEMIERRLATL